MRNGIVLAIALTVSACEGSGYRDVEADISAADASTDGATTDGASISADASKSDAASEASIGDAQDTAQNDAANTRDGSQDTAATCPDRDRDGFTDYACGGSDCNDNDPQIAPGAAERCNAKDNNCDGTIDFSMRVGVGNCLQTYPGVMTGSLTSIRCLVYVVPRTTSLIAHCAADDPSAQKQVCWYERKFVTCGPPS